MNISESEEVFEYKDGRTNVEHMRPGIDCRMIWR